MLSELNRRDLFALSTASAIGAVMPKGISALAPDAQGSACQDLGMISVKDPAYGVIGDGCTDDTVEIQKVLNSGAKTVVFPPGRYCFSSLVIPNWLHMVGQTYEPGVGTGDVVLKSNLTSGTSLIGNASPYIENIIIDNSASVYDENSYTLTGSTATAIQTNGSITLRNVQFQKFYRCIDLRGDAHYVKTYGVEFNRCEYGYYTDSGDPHNLHIDSPISRRTKHFISGTSQHRIHDVKIFGGSVEHFASITEYVDYVAVFGTYFETDSGVSSYIAGFDSFQNDATVNLYGCMIYLSGCSKFVDMAGLDGVSLISIGNTFIGADASAANCIIFNLPNSGNVLLKGDGVRCDLQAGVKYVNSLNNVTPQYDITFPILPYTNTQYAFSEKNCINSNGVLMPALAAAPASPLSGQMVLADGVHWDPLGKVYGRPYWVLWQGDRWYPVSG